MLGCLQCKHARIIQAAIIVRFSRKPQQLRSLMP
jgi:hypothetical protein